LAVNDVSISEYIYATFYYITIILLEYLLLRSLLYQISKSILHRSLKTFALKSLNHFVLHVKQLILPYLVF